jgi:hypothetical protein
MASAGRWEHSQKIVYVKAVPECLDLFLQRYLTLIQASTRFALITGDADTTLPRQVDQRFPDYVASGLQQRLLNLLDDPRLLHWYAENLDIPLVGVTPIPLAWINSDGHVIYQQTITEAAPIAIRARPLRGLVCPSHQGRSAMGDQEAGHTAGERQLV